MEPPYRLWTHYRNRNFWYPQMINYPSVCLRGCMWLQLLATSSNLLTVSCVSFAILWSIWIISFLCAAVFGRIKWNINVFRYLQPNTVSSKQACSKLKTKDQCLKKCFENVPQFQTFKVLLMIILYQLIKRNNLSAFCTNWIFIRD